MQKRLGNNSFQYMNVETDQMVSIINGIPHINLFSSLLKSMKNLKLMKKITFYSHFFLKIWGKKEKRKRTST
jgi:hypothetical protein